MVKALYLQRGSPRDGVKGDSDDSTSGFAVAIQPAGDYAEKHHQRAVEQDLLPKRTMSFLFTNHPWRREAGSGVDLPARSPPAPCSRKSTRRDPTRCECR